MAVTTAISPSIGVRTAHPPATYLLCFVEMLERFSYYSMSGLLVLFLAGAPSAGGFGWPNALAIELFGIYVGCLWFAPLLGGWIGDNFLGARRAVILGGLLVVTGQALMATPAIVPASVAAVSHVPVQGALAGAGVPLGFPLPGADVLAKLAAALAAQTGHAVNPVELQALSIAYEVPACSFILGLVLLAVGNGLLKPNITVMLGEIYDARDPRRESAFTLFYIGINVGAVLSALLAGTVAERLGWAIGFGISSVMVLIGVTALVIFGRLIPKRVGARRTIEAPGVRRPPLPRGPLLHVIVMTLLAAIFWGAFMQTFGLLSLFAYHDVDRDFRGFVVPAAWFGSLTPFFLTFIGPLFQLALDGLRRRGVMLDTQQRFMLGFVVAAAAFVMLATAIALQPAGGKTAMAWLGVFYLILSIAELSLSPAGNAMIGRLVPTGMAGRLMAIWFLCYGLGSFLSAGFGSLSQIMSIPAVLGCLALSLVAAAAILKLFGGSVRSLTIKEATR